MNSEKKKASLVLDVTQDGDSLSAVAKRYRVSRSTAFRWVKEYKDASRAELLNRTAQNGAAEEEIRLTNKRLHESLNAVRAENALLKLKLEKAQLIIGGHVLVANTVQYGGETIYQKNTVGVQNGEEKRVN